MKIYLTQIDPPPRKCLTALREKGWDPIHWPMREVRFGAARPVESVAGYAAIAITSKKAALWFLKQDFPKPWPKLAVVGRNTASLFDGEGAELLCEPARNGTELAADIRKNLAPPAPILFLGGAKVASGLTHGLAGYRLSREVVYETLRIDAKNRGIPNAGMVYFQAPSTIEDFSELYGFRPEKIAVIGDTTRRSLSQLDWQADFQPSRPELDTFVKELPRPDWFGGQRSEEKGR